MDRKYALTKVSSGDWLLPSNDGGTIWRLRTYEDGPSHGLDWPRDLMVWGVWKYVGRNLAVLDPDDWDQWAMVEGDCLTRSEAITRALQLNP